MLYEKLQEHLLRDGMCLLDLHTAVSVIIHHNDAVDCNTRDAAGLAFEIGTPVAVFSTCLDDLMLQESKKKLYGCSSILLAAFL